MPVINTNVSSVIARNALNKNEIEMTKAMEKLSTGKRINTSGDDAAGMAITSRMSAQISGLDQAARNANDGISMIQTAESAYIEVSDMLQRMRQLAIQAASETYGDVDRQALDLEYQQLGDEVNRIASTTEWNGFMMLDGTVGDGDPVKIQSGANALQTVDIAFGTLYGKAHVKGENFISDASGALVTATANGSFTSTITNPSGATGAVTSHSVKIANAASLEENDYLIFTVTENDGKTTHEVSLKLSADMVTDINDTTAAVAIDTNAVVEDGKTLSNVAGTLTDGNAGAALGLEIKSTGTAGTITIAGTDFDKTTAALGTFTISDIQIRRGLTANLSGTDLSKQTKATAAITALDTTIDEVNAQRATYGSFISRLEHAAQNLTNVSANTAASRSRILDADYARETTELARTQIIQQAGTAMLAQANQIKQTVLSLLK